MNWALIIILSSTHAYHIEFYTETACEQAKLQIEQRHMPRFDRMTVFCVNRGMR